MPHTETVSAGETPYFPFPDNPKTITVGNIRAQEYISPLQMEGLIKTLSNKISLKKYEAVLVNMNGGMFLYYYLSRLQNYKKSSIQIEYHRPQEGYGAVIKIPVPKKYKDKKVLIIDDIYDTGGVFQEIMKNVDSSSQAVVLVTKKDIPNQIKIPNILIGVIIDNKWVGGSGMDLGIPGEENTFRNFPGLVVKI
jgi:hypoxanthine-guanine phosphoribosyltransferase